MKILLTLTTIILVLTSCSDSKNAHHDKVDALNQRAYFTRFQSLDSTAKYSQMALDLAQDYDEGRAEAFVNQAFVEYMLMDYDKSRTLYLRARELSHSILTQAVADVGLMKICQMTGRNEEFYGYHSDAQRKLRRIDEEQEVLTANQLVQYRYAKSEFHLASASYYNYIFQEDLGASEIEEVSNNLELFSTDSAQLARYYILTGEYERALDVARRANLTYMHASVLQKMAQRMTATIDQQTTDTIMPFALSLAQMSLQMFREYGSIYSQATTYLTISDYYLQRNMPEVALDTATKALELVNIQHRRVCSNDSDFIVPFTTEADTVSTEMLWMMHGHNNCAWEWIATIREQLSIIYSAMDMKEQSDYNRNIYLDILDATRQDLQLSHQLTVLQEEQRWLNLLILFVSMLSVMLFAGLAFAVRWLKRSSEKNYAIEVSKEHDAFQKWMDDNEIRYNNLEEEEKKIDSETYLHEQHIAENKRSYIDKCTSLSLVYSINPFLDRAINELNKLKDSDETPEVRAERVDYLKALIDQICLYNEILSHWIKVRQGIVNLNVESFELQPLIDTLAKNTKSFSYKGIDLQLPHTDAVLKADKALTLFMLNTLLDNARKYTPEGGQVRVDADVHADYVELSVSDTGCGMSAEDVRTICNEKVYDAGKIGNTADKEHQNNKGFGFGLMNCKGIIDKYKKTNSLFSVCMFGIESEEGKGSRFYFRLPKGVVRLSVFLCILFSVSQSVQAINEDRITSIGSIGYSVPLLQQASAYADSVYYANVDGHYDRALQFADSALTALNDYYLQQNPDGKLLLSLTPTSEYTDILLWHSGFATDYIEVMDIRNEAAVAALALHQWELYRYNNEIYFRLYKLVSQDNSLEEVSDSVRKANMTRETLVVVAVVVLVLCVIIGLIVYYRVSLLPTFNLRQLIQFKRRLFADNYDNLVSLLAESINDIKPIRGLALGIQHEDGKEFSITKSQDWELGEDVLSVMKQGTEKLFGTELHGGQTRIYPLFLILNVDGDRLVFPPTIDSKVDRTEEPGPRPCRKEYIGALAIEFSDSALSANDRGIIQAMSGFLSTYIYYSHVRMADGKQAIQLKEDERLRAEREEQTTHIQNMVLDNCLSAIKHETMYYPARLRQMLSVSDIIDERSKVDELHELVSYYKEVFTLLSSCAARQLENVQFKCRHFSSVELGDYAQKAMKKRRRRLSANILLDIDNNDRLVIVGDKQLLCYLIDNLLSAALRNETAGILQLRFYLDNACPVISLTDTRTTLDAESIDHLFYPENLRYDEDSDTLIGAEYLVCKQIVRAHDEYSGMRGCGIRAFNSQQGFTVEAILKGYEK